MKRINNVEFMMAMFFGAVGMIGLGILAISVLRYLGVIELCLRPDEFMGMIGN